MEPKDAEPAIPETYNAFFYGTLMAPEVLHRVIYGSSKHNPSASLTITPALLPNYCRHRVRSADYPGIIFESGHTVRGTFVTGLTPKNMQSLDWFEGPEYERKVVTVKILTPKDKEHVHDASGIMGEAVETGEEKEAQTYVFKHVSLLERGEWDFAFFRREKLRYWADESEEYAGLWMPPQPFYNDGDGLTKSRTSEVDANAAESTESETGTFESRDQGDTTGGRGVKTSMGKELKELADKKREEEWILGEKKKIAEEGRSKGQCTVE
ncbi:hypothetical protein DSL72_005640 [Monilinia vaccinii-corymbosi]|uniref:Putative gamma-glutamylcyclotransferase n=1 Tax=Monilinia vaccinii-corymbosi TaxID=61207 RepID=A0A8A3PG62_9HELO|nr:hypothetical protein DSL72_005640 [Monilinia vaccinii-corymbosi]